MNRRGFLKRVAIVTGGALSLETWPTVAQSGPQLKEIKGYRAMFDLKPTDSSPEPIDLRLYLRLGRQPLTETWLYQWTPPPPAERKF